MERKRLLNISLWVVAFLLINIIWANVATNEASKQLNDRGFEFQSERDVSIQAVFGSDACFTEFSWLFVLDFRIFDLLGVNR